MKAAAVVNPRAGGGGAGRAWRAVARELEERLGGLEVRFTDGRGQGAELATELAAAGCDPVIAAGGDGTLNEVVNGVLEAGTDTRVGLLPLGSGGDFARSLGLRGMRHAVETLAAGRARRVDAVLVRQGGRERYAVNVASAGLGARVARRVAGGWGMGPAPVRYLAASARELLAGGRWRLRVSLDGVAPLEREATTLALANGRFQGGGVEIAPLAEIDDGLMDVTLIAPAGVVELAMNLRRLYSGGIHGHPKVSHWRAARVTVEGEGAVPFEIDGEPAGDLPVEAVVRAGAWRLIAPAGAGATGARPIE